MPVCRRSDLCYAWSIPQKRTGKCPTLQVIDAGFGGKTTTPLRMALDMLEVGPCYHMENELQEMNRRVPHRPDVLDGKPDWDRVFDGFVAAVDWPTSAYWLLVFEAKDGWEPLCSFLDLPVPDALFSRSNCRQEFFNILAGKSAH